jgi:ABC-2 type transport system ATP-binding protein
MMAPLPAIAVHGLGKSYGRHTALQAIDFTVAPGELFGLIGPDGAGKTTTFQILAGVLAPTTGQITILGRSPRAARLSLGYLTQPVSLYPDLSVMENLGYSAGLRRVPSAVWRQRAMVLLQQVGLHPFGDRLARQLSGGMRQKLALGCALIAQPQVLLLDEPTTGVDPVSRREFWDVLAAVVATGVTVVVATPYLDEAERCHRIALLYDGQIQQVGTPADLRAALGVQRLEVWTDGVAAEPVLRSQLGSLVVDLQPVGDRLDVLVTDAQRGQDQVRQCLTHHGIPIDAIRQDQPTLDHVFVSHLRQRGADPPHRPFPAHRPAIPMGGVAIAAQGLQKTFGSFPAVRGVTLTIHHGEIYGLLGANGAGKTTTIKMLCGLLSPSGGTIALAGETQALHRPEVRSRIGYMSQKFTLYDDLTVQQNLSFYCGVYGVPPRRQAEKIDWVLYTCGLHGREQTLTGRLPGGWKQRVAFGASILHEPDILFLDEPTSGVDPLARRQFWRLIRTLAQRGTAILVTTHYLDEAENCTQMGLMVGGAIAAQGSPRQIKESQPGQVLDLTTDCPQAASEILTQHLPAWRVARFGDRLHVMLEDRDPQCLVHWLAQAQIEVRSLQPIPYSLEDAFISMVQRASHGESIAG